MQTRISTLTMMLLLLTSGASAQELEHYVTGAGDTISLPADPLNFFVLGDWGRYGDVGQQETADAMNRVGKIVEPEFFVSTGDNFYDDGVASIDDPQWMLSFEEIYRGSVFTVPWYVCLGNHDYRGNVQAQIDYSNISRRWNLLGRYFTKDVELEDETGHAKLVVIDTSPLNDEYHTEAKYYQVTLQDTTRQLEWIDSVLTASKAKWDIAIGHHPMYTGGKRRDDSMYVRTHLEELMARHNVQAYFCGHEHDLQHIKPDHVPTHHFVSGAGSDIRKTGLLPESVFAKAENGYMIVSLVENQMYVHVMNFKDEVLHRVVIDRIVE